MTATYPIDRTASRAVELLSGDERQSALIAASSGLAALADAEASHAVLRDDVMRSGLSSLRESVRARNRLADEIEGEGRRSLTIADAAVGKIAAKIVDDGFATINRVYDDVSPHGFVPYPPDAVTLAAEYGTPAEAYAYLTRQYPVYVAARDGKLVPGVATECPIGQDCLDPLWPWNDPVLIDEPGGAGGVPVELPGGELPPGLPDDPTDPTPTPSPDPAAPSCPAPVVQCPSPPDIYVNVSPPSVTVDAPVNVTVEGCVGSPCQACPSPEDPVQPAPSPDPACEPASRSLSRAASRGWSVSPVPGETPSRAPWSQYYVVAGPTGIVRRALVTGSYGTTPAGRTRSGADWAAYGLYTVPPGINATFAEWDPDDGEPAVVECDGPSPSPSPVPCTGEDDDPEDCECPLGETCGIEPYPECERDNSCEEPEPEEPSGGGGGTPTTPPPPPPPPARPPIGRLGQVDGPGGMLTGEAFCEWVVPPELDGGTPYSDWNIDGVFEKFGASVGGATTIPPMFSGIMSLLGVPGAKWLQGFTTVIKGANKVFSPIAGKMGISNPTAMETHMSLDTVRGWVDRIAGCDSTYYFSGVRYLMQYQNPMLIPTQGEINGMLLSDTIATEEWECMTRANGNVPSHALNVVKSQRAKPNATECIAAFKRKYIDETQFVQRMRGNGYIEEQDYKLMERLFEQIPTFSDIIRFMVRDAFNEETVKNGGLDNGFDDNFTDQAKEWAEANGLTPDVARLFWRAHWEFPSNTALYEMIRRLRPGRVDDGMAVTRDDARKVMQINDVAPQWVDRMLAVSYNPLTRTDLKIGYMNNAIDEAELIEKLQDTGLNADDAKFVVGLYEREKTLRDTNPTAKIMGWTRREIVNRYIDGTVGEAEAIGLLGQFGMIDDDIAQVIENANLKAEVVQREKCSTGWRKRYMIGEATYAEVVAGLTALGYAAAQATRVADRWSCERSARRKELPAARNQTLYTRGIITRDDYMDRLKNLGYRPRDVDNLTAEADARIAEKVAESVIAALKEREAKSRANLKMLEQKIKDAEKKLKDAEKKSKGKSGQSNNDDGD
jgi:Holliday junction resolvasome RuvABC DNA-binding subunit